jgi:hypothetical protein
MNFTRRSFSECSAGIFAAKNGAKSTALSEVNSADERWILIGTGGTIAQLARMTIFVALTSTNKAQVGLAIATSPIKGYGYFYAPHFPSF